jgi:hypothetical protein
MNTEEITGGVSPLKAKWKGTASRSGGQKRSISGKRGGAAGIRNTSKKSGKYAARKARGFSQTGAKGSNVHGYGALTRFKPIVTKDYKGPIAAATTPKSGGSGSGSGGGGGDTYNYGDYHDESVYTDKSINTDIKDSDFSTNVNSIGGTITNKTNTKVIKKDKNIQKNKTNQKSKTFMSIWNNNEKNVQGKYGTYEEFEKAAIKWNNSAAGRKYWANKNKTNQNISSDQNLENVGNIGDSDASGGDISHIQGGLHINPQYDPAKRSPNKMKSHAWSMIQKQKKARGGTQKY